MPELPEVEVVRLGLAPVVTGATVLGIDVLDERALTRHVGGAADFVARLEGATLAEPRRRGKFLWAPLARLPEPASIRLPESAPVRLPEPVEGSLDHSNPHPAADSALLAHLGMSGQLLIRDPAASDDRHARIRMRLDGPRGRYDVAFVDQRTFGSLAVDALVPADPPQSVDAPREVDCGGASGARAELVPSQVAHIARDPLDPAFDDDAFVTRLRLRRSAVKSALLDQTLVAGIGNIYADE
ncbi:MAG: DNA-formamidopyrimidine glycosylase family protein, partial [Pseudoclavibacter sp.]